MDEVDYLLDALKLLVYLGLTNPKGGNGSIRVDDGKILITPSGIPKHLLAREDLVLYDIASDKSYGKHKPSIEIYAHIETYKVRDDVNAVLHAHTPLSTALTDEGLKEWWASGTVEAEYSLENVVIVDEAPPGSRKLAENIASGFSRGARIVIVPRHGVFAVGRNVSEALDSIIALESTAKYVLARKILKIFSCCIGMLGTTRFSAVFRMILPYML